MAAQLFRKMSRLFGTVYKLAGVALNYSFPSNTVLADAGQALLDEHRIILLRRKILAGVAAHEKSKARIAAAKAFGVVIPRAVAAPPVTECCLPEGDEVGTDRTRLETPAERFEPRDLKADERTDQQVRRQLSDGRLAEYYAAAHGMADLSALCLSGGGIRSAAFA